MKIKLDENIPLSVQPLLIERGHDVDTVNNESLSGCTDERLFAAIQETGRFLITQDLDFSDISRFKPGSHAGILILRLRSGGRQAISQRLQYIFLTESVENWTRCLIIISEKKIRLRRP